MLYNNASLQNAFCEKFNFNPVGNLICLNWLPKNFKGVIQIDDNFLKDIKQCGNQKGKNKKFWIWPISQEKNEENFPDPNNYLIGVYIMEKSVSSILKL